MTILGIETATAICAAALVRDGQCLDEQVIEASQVHSEKLVTLIDTVLRAHAVLPTALDAIAVSIGPGSYTGLRIGLSVAKGLAYATGTPLVAVPTLEALAFNGARLNSLAAGDRILTLIESRRDELFTALYHVDSTGVTEECAPAPLGLPELAALLAGKTNISVVGSGAEVFQQFLEKQPLKPESIYFPPRERRQCSAASVALCGAARFARQEIADLASTEPQYLKEFYTTARPQQYPVH